VLVSPKRSRPRRPQIAATISERKEDAKEGLAELLAHVIARLLAGCAGKATSASKAISAVHEEAMTRIAGLVFAR
jgi:hypothetical protein